MSLNKWETTAAIVGGFGTAIGTAYAMDALPVLQFQMTAHVVVADSREFDRLIGEWYRAQAIKTEYELKGQPAPVWILKNIARLETELRKLGWTRPPG